RKRHARLEVPGERVHRSNVDLLARENLGEIAQQPLAVHGIDDDVDREYLVAAYAPIGADQSFGLSLLHARDVAAALSVDGDALAAGDEADDRIGRRWLAAACEPGHQAIYADDQDAAAGARRPALARQHRFVSCGRRGSRLGKRVNRSLHLPRVELG